MAHTSKTVTTTASRQKAAARQMPPAIYQRTLLKECMSWMPPSACAAVERASTRMSPPASAACAAGILRAPKSWNPCRTACIRKGTVFLQAHNLPSVLVHNLLSTGQHDHMGWLCNLLHNYAPEVFDGTTGDVWSSKLHVDAQGERQARAAGFAGHL